MKIYLHFTFLRKSVREFSKKVYAIKRQLVNFDLRTRS